MKRDLYKSGLILIILFIIVSGPIYGQDWPGWRGTNRDGKIEGFKYPSSWPGMLKLKWEVKVGLGDASPVLAGNRIYVHGKLDNNDILWCLDATTGKEIWKESSPAAKVTGQASSHPGPRSTPEVAEGKVVSLGAEGTLTCHDATSGKVLWKNTEYINEVPAFYIGTSPILYGGKCFVHLGSKQSGYVISFDLKTGVETWKWTGDPPTYSSPVIMTLGNEKILIVQTAISLVGLRMNDGKLIFRYLMVPERRFYNASTPVIDDQVIYLTGQGIGTRAIRVDKQRDSCRVTEIWTNKEFGTSFNSVVLKNGFLYGFESKMGYLFCIHSITGATCWRDSTRLDQFGSIVDAGLILVATAASNSLMIFFKPNGKFFEPIIRYRVANSPIYAHPIISGNRLYIKDKEILTLWTLD